MQCVSCGDAIPIKRTGRSEHAECKCKTCGARYAYSAWTISETVKDSGTRLVDRIEAYEIVGDKLVCTPV